MRILKILIIEAIIGAIIGAIIALGIYFWDTTSYENDWGDIVRRPDNSPLMEILPGMLIGAIAVPISIFLTGNQRF